MNKNFFLNLAQINQIEISDVVENGANVSIIKIVFILIGFILIRILTKQMMYVAVGRILERQGYSSKKEMNKRKETIVVASNTILSVLYIIVAIIMILNEFGVNFSALITAFGALGVVAGIAGQSIIKDFLRGMYPCGSQTTPQTPAQH